MYGPNGSGKSSIIYAAYVIRNFFENPSQRLNNLFNFRCINLGGFDNIINKTAFEGLTIGLTSNIELRNFYKNPNDLATVVLKFSDFLAHSIKY